VDVKARERSIRVTFPDDWLAHHPLTELDLAQEARYLRAIGYELYIKE
jgi:exopolyphosphatase/guanosine-5'-triphosphate,3'-diphosphate pyrophosphatase